MTQIYTRTPFPHLLQTTPVYEQTSGQHISRDSRRFDTASPLHLARQYEGNGWNRLEPHSPVPNINKGFIEMSAAKTGDMLYQSRPEAVQKPTREQLPPLSSLFGSSHSARPSPSTYSNGNSPVFPTTSPNDPRHPATPIHPDRPYDTSYFQRPPMPRHFSYNSRPEHSEKLGIPPPPRPTQLGHRPESPRYDSRYGHPEEIRPLGPLPIQAWSPHAQPNRQEYFSRDTSSSFRPHPDHRHQAQMHRPELNSGPAYREGQHSGPVTPTFPPTSVLMSDPATTKDGLGPKIWTGTQFLPRFVRQAEVSGEGMCYFYDDGTHCKTVIDGEIVNAHWGVTKAGKPRKRLAIACITCREKKIKCDPDYPRCVQCEKFGRICKFKNAPRGGHGSPDTPPSDPEDNVSRPASSRGDADSFRGEKREASHSASPRDGLRQITPDFDVHHTKRQRTGYNDFTPVASEASPRPSIQDSTSPITAWAAPVNSGPIERANIVFPGESDPYTSQPMLVAELVSVFFKHAPETVYCMFPNGPFTSWVLSSNNKSPDDLMLVYTILALGTVFSLKPEYKSFGIQCAATARHACDNSRFSIQLVQSRILLALYYFSTNKAEDAWDFCGGAIRAAGGLKLNLEIEKTDDAYRKVYPYGLNRSGFAECRRRTFWACYLVDRYNGSCSGHLSIVHPEDIFLRLPCDANSFESQLDTQNPFFDAETPPIQNINWTVGSLAYLINVSTIWGDVMANIYRTSQRPSTSPSKATFATFYDNATLKLRIWNESLPKSYVFSTENLARSSSDGSLGTYVMMHTVYHATAMKLNRYIQHSTLTNPQLAHHIFVAKQHSEALLKVVDTLQSFRNSKPMREGSQAKFSSPFMGYAVVSAIDILTAKTTVSTIPSRIASFSGSQSILAEIAQFWQSAKNQQALVQQRTADLMSLVRDKDGSAEFSVTALSAFAREIGDGSYEVKEAIEKTFSRDYDCIYA